MDSIPRFMQGVFSFTGAGLARPVTLEGGLAYAVPADRRAQLIYFRAGSSADALVNLVLLRDGRPMRYFPLGAKGAMHVPLAVVEDLIADHVTGKNRDAAYHGSKLATKLKVMGVELASMGLTMPADERDEVVQFAEPRRGTYKKLIVRDGRLVGGIR